MQLARSRSRQVRLAVALCTTASAVTGLSGVAPGASAAPNGVYWVIAGPRYSTSNALSNNQKLDCSTANPYFDINACSLVIDTVTSGCIWEQQSTDSSSLNSTPCRVHIAGPVPWRKLPAYCYLGTTEQSLAVTYTVGNLPGRQISPFTFYTSAVLKPTAFNANATATRRYSMTIAGSSVATATGQGVVFGLGTISEVFTVDFAYPVKDVCPNRDNAQYSIGTVKDARSDVIAQDNASSGFIRVDGVTT